MEVNSINGQPISGGGIVLIASNGQNGPEVTLPAGYVGANTSIKVVFPSGYSNLNNTAMTLNGTVVVSNQNGTLAPLPRHQITSGTYSVLQSNTTLDLYYTADYDGQGTPAWVVIGNPVVLSSSDYTIYADGKVGDISIGTVQYTYEATAPYGWLFLQGQTLSRTTYKKLWDWASANNYVGSGKPFGAGDGSTTFTLPNLGGEFIRTKGINVHTHQGNGAGTVGEHQDATIIPNFLLNYNNGFEFFGMGHLQVFSNFQDYAYNDPSDQVWVDKTNTGSIGQTHMTSFTTRPTNTSLNVKMKVR